MMHRSLSILIACAFLAQPGVAQRKSDEARTYRSLTRAMESFGAVMREVHTTYVDDVDAETMVQEGISAMLKHLDPYSTYMRSDETEELDMLSTGNYVGFGISVARRDGILTITDVRDDGPAYGTGMRIGDRLVAVDSVRTDTMVPSELRPHSRGSSGTTSTLKLTRDGLKDTIVVRVTRRELPVRVVSHAEVLPGGIGYIRLERFARGTGSAVRKALSKFRDECDLKGIVLDLRDNPGGLLDAAVDVVELFVPRGSVIVSTRGRSEQERKTYVSNEDPIEPTAPLAVLINRSSASASEIVAGAIQDLDRGVIIGERSFGKGLVQTMAPMPNDATLKLTTSRYYTPSGRSIQAIDYRAARETAASHTKGSSHALPGLPQFNTLRGRKVEQLHGIDPDTVVSDSVLPSLLAYVDRSGAFSSFASVWTSKRDSLPAGFKVDKGLLEQCYDYIDSLPAEKKSAVLQELASNRRKAAEQGYSPSALKGLEQAERAIERDFSRALRQHQAAITEILEREIRIRFGTDQVRQSRMLRTDPLVRVARDILNSANYTTMLGGQVPADQ